ncbi:MAG TPA: hypothetical protein VMQ65_01725 [Candidatus Limnocylindria bacterium]|nr:hypothetical protein [Candidatus Limnocylindria bacterium]
MARRSKRTYNLAERTVHRVRELSELYGASRTQESRRTKSAGRRRS